MSKSFFWMIVISLLITVSFWLIARHHTMLATLYLSMSNFYLGAWYRQARLGETGRLK